MALIVGTNTYVTEAEADAYFAGSINSGPWDSADTTTREKALISGTRNIDMNDFVGEKTSPTQELEWPRTGVPGFDDVTVPDDIKEAEMEMALYLISNPDFAQTQDNSNNIESLKAGSAEISYFNRIESTGNPTVVNKLISPYIDGNQDGTTIGAPIASGTCDPSTFEDIDRFNVNEGI